MVDVDFSYLLKLAEKNGPDPHDYLNLDKYYQNIHSQVKDKIFSIQPQLSDLFSVNSLQGFAMVQPHGYAGDFEMIDKLYQQHISNDKKLWKWDIYFQNRPAVRAVRNRKDFFKNILKATEALNKQAKILNVGSGPGRDVYEYFLEHPASELQICCVDADEKAIKFASELTLPFNKNLVFHHKNIFRYKSDEKFDLVWSAGLFDYLDNKCFKHLIRKLFNMLTPGGELIVGNFGTQNPTRAYMEFGGWVLNHRDEDELIHLVEKVGVAYKSVAIESEAEGINLFLRVKS